MTDIISLIKKIYICQLQHAFPVSNGSLCFHFTNAPRRLFVLIRERIISFFTLNNLKLYRWKSKESFNISRKMSVGISVMYSVSDSVSDKGPYRPALTGQEKMSK